MRNEPLPPNRVPQSAIRNSRGARPDYVLIGHVARDLIGTAERVGGTALYAGLTAARLGRRVGIITAHAADLQLPSEMSALQLARTPSDRTTTFAIGSTAHGRNLRLIQRAAEIRREDVPEPWRACSILHIAPIVAEVPSCAACWFEATVVGATGQGWLRCAREDGAIVPAPDELERLPLEGLSALVLSIEDIGGDAGAAQRASARVPIVVLTRGADGGTLYVQGRASHVPAYPAREVDSTGAGDVFAAAFFVRLGETSDPEASARFASCAAALSVEGIGTAAIPDRDQIQLRLEHRWRG